MFNVPVQDPNPLASSDSNAYCYGIIKELYATKVHSIPTLNSMTLTTTRLLVSLVPTVRSSLFLPPDSRTFGTATFH